MDKVARKLFGNKMTKCPVVGHYCGFYQKEKCYKHGDPVSIRTKRDEVVRANCPTKRGRKPEQPVQLDWVNGR